MTKIGHVEPKNWYSSQESLRASAYANSPILEPKRIYDGYDKDGLSFLEMSIWNPSIISNTIFHKPMFDCIIAYRETIEREFELERAKDESEHKKMDALVRDLEDITRVDLHFHELIEEVFGCDVNDIDDHNTDAAWLYDHKLKYTQKDMDDAVNKVQNRTVQLENSNNLLSSKLSSRSVMFFIIGISLGWLIFN